MLDPLLLPACFLWSLLFTRLTIIAILLQKMFTKDFCCTLVVVFVVINVIPVLLYLCQVMFLTSSGRGRSLSFPPPLFFLLTTSPLFVYIRALFVLWPFPWITCFWDNVNESERTIARRIERKTEIEREKKRRVIDEMRRLILLVYLKPAQQLGKVIKCQL